MSVPSLAGTRRNRLAAVERERERLLDVQDAFSAEDDRAVGQVTKSGSKPPQWCRFLHALVAHLEPTSVVEMGTGVGMSGAAMATALPPGGRLWTVDMRPESSRHARDVFAAVGVEAQTVTGTFTDVLQPVLEEAAPVDLLFVDGHHNRRATLAYTEVVVPFMSPRGVVIYDDIRWSHEMLAAWETLQAQKRWSWTHDLHVLGVCSL